MPRQLPWKVNTGSKRPSSRPPAPDRPPSRSPAAVDRPGSLPATTPKSGTSTPVGGRSRRSLAAQVDRSPSTSPPPEPMSESFMLEGFDRDDGYRMVEDEFLAMAGNFTKHLHAAEYQRLKALASTRNADMIRTISRPVMGQMTDLVKRRRSALGLAASQRKGVRNALGKRKGGREDSGSDDDGDVPWAGTSLHGLMESPQKKAVPLPAALSFHHGDRASTAFGKPSQPTAQRVSGFPSPNAARTTHTTIKTTTDEDDEDDEDLDTKPTFVAGTNKIKRSESSTLSLNQKVASCEAIVKSREPSLPSYSNYTPPSTSTVRPREAPPVTSTTEASEEHDEDDEDFLARIRSRRARQRRRHEGSGTEDDKNKGKNRSAVDAIPLF